MSEGVPLSCVSTRRGSFLKDVRITRKNFLLSFIRPGEKRESRSWGRVMTEVWEVCHFIVKNKSFFIKTLNPSTIFNIYTYILY